MHKVEENKYVFWNKSLIKNDYDVYFSKKVVMININTILLVGMMET